MTDQEILRAYLARYQMEGFTDVPGLESELLKTVSYCQYKLSIRKQELFNLLVPKSIRRLLAW